MYVANIYAARDQSVSTVFQQMNKDEIVSRFRRVGDRAISLDESVYYKRPENESKRN